MQSFDTMAAFERLLLDPLASHTDGPFTEPDCRSDQRPGRPPPAVPAVHVTGTNGKTTTARMIDDILRAHDLRVGRFTSPHLETVRKRIVIDGKAWRRTSSSDCSDGSGRPWKNSTWTRLDGRPSSKLS
ncbi:Mur ligase family protein [Nocardia sp. NPDC051911]|uniref:Mur ligase family protein n=1 Tax=Nocardia sp. NPDC051911 TaxID=3154648 RepID=UPI00342F3522